MVASKEMCRQHLTCVLVWEQRVREQRMRRVSVWALRQTWYTKIVKPFGCDAAFKNNPLCLHHTYCTIMTLEAMDVGETYRVSWWYVGAMKHQVNRWGSHVDLVLSYAVNLAHHTFAKSATFPTHIRILVDFHRRCPATTSPGLGQYEV